MNFSVYTPQVRLVGAVCVLSGALSSMSIAQAQSSSIRLGETRLTPELELSYYTDSNVYRTTEDEVDAAGFMVSPTLSWKADIRTTALSAEYAGDYSQGDVDRLDYDNHSLSLNGSTEFSKRSQLRGELSYSRKNLTSDDELSLASGGTSLIESDTLNLRITHLYGADQARGNIRTGLAMRDRSYATDDSGNTRVGYTEISPYGEFSLRVGSTLRAFTGLQFRNVDYETGNYDRQQTDAYVGLDWPESEVFGTRIKVGFLSIEFPDDAERDGSDYGLEIGGFYRPTDYSRFDFSAGRRVYDVSDISESDDAIFLNEFDLVWNHEWSSRLSHEAFAGADILERGCTSQNQVNTNVGVDMGYSVRRWLKIGGGVEFSGRDFDGCDSEAGTDTTFDYSRQELSVFFVFTL